MISRIIGSSARGLKNIWMFYYTGFREMTVGKTLWIIILIKLFIFFIVMKMLFFPNYLSSNFDNDKERADHVRHELTNR
ncbi:MAG: DUF4492 domain-containing protein [Muribaculaceae bacterium]|nr:DUF4492 domain-containing protein [Muribaculaceae bacterium]ROS82701.1 DUF4492 domain-containing protein [Muribaculaceae bacterium Isolate-036 (Harlan)]